MTKFRVFLILALVLFTIGLTLDAINKGSYMIIIPPNTYEQAPDGVIVWVKLQERVNWVKFIQPIDRLSSLIMVHQYQTGYSIKALAYNRHIYGFVSEGVGSYLWNQFLGEYSLVYKKYNPFTNSFNQKFQAYRAIEGFDETLDYIMDYERFDETELVFEGKKIPI